MSVTPAPNRAARTDKFGEARDPDPHDYVAEATKFPSRDIAVRVMELAEAEHRKISWVVREVSPTTFVVLVLKDGSAFDVL